MKKRSLSYNLLLLMFAIYLISALQFLIKETLDLTKLARMSYGEKLDHLDKQYYRNYFYRYYIWLNDLLPKDVSFSIYSDKNTDQKVYLRYVHKLDYYFYPRYVLFKGVEQEVADSPDHFPANGKLNYSEAVLVLNNKEIPLRSYGRLKYASLNGKKYIYAAELDDKALLLESSFVRKSVIGTKAWSDLNIAFFKIYGFAIDKADLK